MRWFVGAVILLVVATILQLGLMVYAMYALLAVMLGSRMVTRYWLAHLTAKRTISHTELEQGQTLTVVLTLKNSGSLPVPWCLVEDLLPREAVLTKPAALEVAGQRIFLEMMAPGGTKVLSYTIQANRRGYYQIGPAVLETGDVFGLHRRYKMLSAPEFITVMPKVVPLAGFDLASRRPLGEMKMSHRLFEDPTRISGIRRYQAGDPIQRVHWAATARTGVLHSKQYEPSCIAGVTIVLDLHTHSYPGKDEPYRSELAITLAIAITNAIQLMDQQIGLITNAGDAAQRVKYEGWAFDARTRDAARKAAVRRDSDDHLAPQVVRTRRGADQFQQIEQMLARAEKHQGLPMPRLIEETISRMPRDATVIPILGEVTDEDALALGILARSGFTVTAILNCFDEYEFFQSAGRLLAQGISARQLKSEEMISEICREQAYPLF
ncbi:MAG: DUF58 domain-containing protein [Pirellulaceae bacterium]